MSHPQFHQFTAHDDAQLAPPPPAPQYPCRYHPKCPIHVHPAPTTPDTVHPPQKLVVLVFNTLNHWFPGDAFALFPPAHPAPPIHATEIVPPVMTNLWHLMYAIEPLVSGPENVRVAVPDILTVV